MYLSDLSKTFFEANNVPPTTTTTIKIPINKAIGELPESMRLVRNERSERTERTERTEQSKITFSRVTQSS